jgi:hypothetical protein
MFHIAHDFLRSAWKRASRAMTRPADANPAELRGLFSQLTDEQKKIGLGFQGPTNHGDPAFLVQNQKT